MTTILLMKLMNLKGLCKMIGIGVFNTEKPLILVRAANGGWVVYSGSEYGPSDGMIGAYSSAKDMISALSEALVPIGIDLPSDKPS